MAAKPTYRELEQRIKDLEEELKDCKQTVTMAFESENLLQKAIDRAPVMAWTVDQKGILTSLAGAGLIGLESGPGQLLGQPLSDVFADHPKVMADTQQALAEKEFFSTMDHKGCVLESHYTPLRNRSGKAIGAIGVATDVTKQVQNEAHYRGLFENAPTSLWEEDLSAVKAYITKLRRTGVNDFKTYFDHHPEALAECAALIKIVDINQTTLDIYGAKHKEELMSGLEQVFTESAYEDLKIQLVAMADGKTDFESEIVNQTLTGAKMHLVLRWFVAPGHEASYSKVFLALTDITDRVIAEKALENSRRDWENIFQAIGHPTIILDPQHRVIAANRVTVEKTGLSPRELMHKRCYEVFHGTSHPPGSCPMEQMMKSGQPQTLEMELEALGGRPARE